MNVSAKNTIERLLARAGIKIDGPDRWDVHVGDAHFYDLVLGRGSLGLGEAYMHGWWDCGSLDEFFFRIFIAGLDKQVPFSMAAFFHGMKARLFNQQTRNLSRRVGKRHYDIGNDLYQRMLDKRMIYSCAYWEDATDLDAAQERKLDLICRKLRLEPGMRLLDIGCGWGGLARYAAENYGVSVVGITISARQAELARQRNADLPVEIRLQDYRDLHGTFDRIVSVGMFEHVGYRNYGTLMDVVSANLVRDGIFLLHTIGGSESRHSIDPWIDRYIFPGSMLPSASQITRAAEGRLLIEDWHNFGLYYDRTCMEWLHNFEQHWTSLRGTYDDTFFRMWKYYLSATAASFRARKSHLWQIVLTRPDKTGGYASVR